ncbi:hypothetical protein Q9L58_003365 [Maublancomyces gigas]|uniref:HNH nuclease domain-containing protein n=1 Tax=Discina gigas TaxID=1032678 RepID=A0ABR3GNZ0_9PEZI
MERLRVSNERTTTDITTSILTAMLEHAPSNDGKQNISEDVIKSSNLSELADLYASTLLIPMLARGGKTTTVTPIPEGFNSTTFDTIANQLTPQNRTRTFKQQLLVRDDYRCVITGYYCFTTYHALADTDEEILRAAGITEDDIAYTEGAHIIPFGLASFSDSDVLLPYLMFSAHLLMLTSTTISDNNMRIHGGLSHDSSPS